MATPRTICVDLGTGIGQVDIDYRVLDPTTVLNITATYDGSSVAAGPVTSDGTLSFIKSTSLPRTAEIVIDAAGEVVNYEITLNCVNKDANAFEVVMVALTSSVDTGKFFHAEYEWDNSGFTSPTQSELVTADLGTGSVVSLNKTILGVPGSGIIPPDGSTVTMRYNKIGFDNLDFPSGGDLLYLRSTVSYALNLPAGVAALLSAATSLSPLDSSGAPDVYEDSFAMPAGPGEKLYLIYDLRKTSELLLCHNPVVRGDSSDSESVCCNCEISDDAVYKPFNGGDPQAGAGAACSGPTTQNIYYHDGSGLTPQIGDSVYEDTAGTTFTPAATGYIKIDDNQLIEVNTSGVITDIQDC
jgi:hypothetical protein